MPPTHFESGNVNMFHPYVVGQSGTLKPDSVLVTSPPTKIRNAVQPAVNRAKRWRAIPSPFERGREARADRAKPEEKARVSRLRQTCDPHLLLRLRPDGLALRALRAAL